MSQLEEAKQFVKDHIKFDGVCKSLAVKSKRTKSEFIIAQQYNSYDGWFVYEGCDLIVGDVTFDYAVQTLLDVTK